MGEDILKRVFEVQPPSSFCLPLQTPWRQTLRRTGAGSCPSWERGERQVHAQQKNSHDDDQANEHVEISGSFHPDQHTSKKAEDSKGHLTLRHRVPPLRSHGGSGSASDTLATGDAPPQAYLIPPGKTRVLAEHPSCLNSGVWIRCG